MMMVPLTPTCLLQLLHKMADLMERDYEQLVALEAELETKTMRRFARISQFRDYEPSDEPSFQALVLAANLNRSAEAGH